jgi:hypothetical protein
MGFQLLHKPSNTFFISSPSFSAAMLAMRRKGVTSAHKPPFLRREVVLLKDEIRQPSLFYRHEAEIRAVPASTHLLYGVNFSDSKRRYLAK